MTDGFQTPGYYVALFNAIADTLEQNASNNGVLKAFGGRESLLTTVAEARKGATLFRTLAPIGGRGNG